MALTFGSSFSTPVPPPPPPPGHRRSRRQRLLLSVGAGLTGVVVAATVAAALVRLPYDTVGPGRTYVVNEVLSVRGRETFPPKGEVLYATVSVREHVSALQALIGWLDPTTDVIPEQKVRGNIPRDQYRQLNVEAMSDSKTAAEILALARIGFTELGVGAQVESVAPDTPAAAVLKDKDLIVAIDGATVRNSTDAVNAIRAHQPGETLRLRVVRDGGAPTDVTADLTRADDGRALLGVRLSTKVELPFEINIDSGEVVGPSAGLSYALELLDVLTPGELTGGVKVAATGEVSPSGAVGPVGGVAQKVTTVKRAGAKVFIVPKDNEAEAKKHAGSGLKVVGVENFDEALTALGSMQGSNALALAKPAPARS